MKELTGGINIKLTARALHRPNRPPVTFEWTAKLLFAFNEGKIPRFDHYDHAFVERMLVIPMRSKFVLDPQAIDYIDPLTNTFLAVPSISTEILPKLRAANMRWLLEGLRLYRAEGLDDSVLPAAGMKNFKTALLLLHSPVGDFLHETIKPAEQEDARVELDEVWAIFRSDKCSAPRRSRRNEDFQQTFKLFVNNHNARSYVADATRPHPVKCHAKGWKMARLTAVSSFFS